MKKRVFANFKRALALFLVLVKLGVWHMTQANKMDIKESDLYAPVKEYLQGLGYVVNGEINSCDMVAQKSDEMMVVELKKSLNLEVILQATERQKVADSVYIAVLKPKNIFKNKKYKRTCHLLRRLEIGLMLVTIKPEGTRVEVVQTAEIFDRVKSRQMNQKKRKQIECEFEKRKTQTTGGVTKTKITTAYREEAVQIAKAIETVGPCAPKSLQHLEIPARRIQNILYGNYYGWFERVTTGIYKVTDRWDSEKESYKHL